MKKILFMKLLKFVFKLLLRVDLLEKKVADYEAILADHHKSIATLAFIQTNLLNEMDRAIKVATSKKGRTVNHATSSKGDDFIN